VNLFSGCLAQQIEPQVSMAAIRVLRRLGYRVLVPGDQVCCGAMHLHNGDRDLARRLAERNLRAFAGGGDDAPLLTSASGCGAHLQEYSRLLGSGEGSALAARVSDIAQFLASGGWPAEIQLLPLPTRVAVHDPCSLANAMGQADGVYRLLGRIPGLRLEPLAGNPACCGAAGTYLIQQPAISAALGADKSEALRQAAPDMVVTSNPGCALQLRAGLRDAGLELEVLHPIELVARQLPEPDNMV
jgi:glycolate oxidase iron-sulfur subunit